jgi:transcriptional regulator of arginine metabolism
MKENSSATRQEAIKILIKQMIISDQKTLVQLLKERVGIETNQAAISRDLRKLGVIKKETNQGLVYELPTSDTKVDLLKLAIMDIHYNEMMIVIKTHSGLASFVGDCIDEKTDLDILGCLAGENVVFIVPKSIKTIKEIYKTVCESLYFKYEF